MEHTTHDDTAERERMIKRIRKILDKTHPNAGAMEGEIEAALGMARKLMDQFNLTHADLATSDDKREEAYKSMRVVKAYERAFRIDTFDKYIASVVDKICDTRHYTNDRTRDDLGRLLRSENGRVRKIQELHFYGLEHDVRAALELYHELIATMRAMARLTLGKTGWKDLNDYCLGFSCRLYARSVAINEASVAECNTTAIVLVKSNLLDRKHDELNLTVNKRSGQKVNRVSVAYLAGKEDAENIHLGKKAKLEDQSN